MFAGPNKFQPGPVFEKAKEDRVDNSHDSHGKVVVPGSPRYTEMDVLHVIRNGVNLAVLLGDDNAALIEIQNDYKDLLIRDHPKRTSAKDDTRELQDDVIKLELAVRDQRLKRQLAEDKVATAKADAEAERYAAEAEEIAEKRKRKRGQPMKLMRAKPRESEKGEKDANFGSGRGVQATNQAPNPSR
ncbi:hypothetical protein HDU90_005107 [Geranomyces variabilis]|nr:hypothetical protein HDU90_005107 [Geranomyces variabilis]